MWVGIAEVPTKHRIETRGFTKSVTKSLGIWGFIKRHSWEGLRWLVFEEKPIENQSSPAEEGCPGLLSESPPAPWSKVTCQPPDYVVPNGHPKGTDSVKQAPNVESPTCPYNLRSRYLEKFFNFSWTPFLTPDKLVGIHFQSLVTPFEMVLTFPPPTHSGMVLTPFPHLLPPPTIGACVDSDDGVIQRFPTP